MALPAFNMRQLLEAGCHFGHQSHRWNPKMAPFIFGARNNIHIIDLAQSVPLLHQALVKVSDVVAQGGRVLKNAAWMGEIIQSPSGKTSIHMASAHART